MTSPQAQAEKIAVSTVSIDDPVERKAAKKLERANAGRVMRRFAKHLALLGFNRKSTFFSRERGEIIQFIHVHKYSFGPDFRIHVCIRVLNDSRPTVTLSGETDQGLGFDGRLFVYSADLASIDRCGNVMARFVEDYAEPWFAAWSVEALLSDRSFLRPEPRAALAMHLAGHGDDLSIRASRTSLGLGPPTGEKAFVRD